MIPKAHTLCFLAVVGVFGVAAPSVAQGDIGDVGAAAAEDAERPGIAPSPTPSPEGERAPEEIAHEVTDGGADRNADDDSSVTEKSRTPIQALNEHFLGSTSRAVRFDWRRSPIILAASVSEVVEKNTFGQWRAGVLGKKAFDVLIVEVGVSLYQSYDTDSSRSLALTPFRQAGRPTHLEMDANVGYAVAEGVVTPLASFMPPAELALVATGGVRYLGYAQSFVDRDLQAIALDLASPQLSTAELDRIERDALGSMLVDPARLHAMAGLSLDVYLQPGLYVSPRAMIAIPVLVPITNSSLGLFWELTLAAGWAL